MYEFNRCRGLSRCQKSTQVKSLNWFIGIKNATYEQSIKETSDSKIPQCFLLALWNEGNVSTEISGRHKDLITNFLETIFRYYSRTAIKTFRKKATKNFTLIFLKLYFMSKYLNYLEAKNYVCNFQTPV